ncbi:MAG: hypothetical protein WBX11_02865 [Thiobacillaceae bacterium]
MSKDINIQCALNCRITLLGLQKGRLTELRYQYLDGVAGTPESAKAAFHRRAVAP